MALNFLLKRSGTASKRPESASMALGELDLNYDASTGGIYYKDSAGNVVKVGPCQVSDTAPNVAPAGSAGNSAGEFWFDTVSQTLQVWSGSAWVDATSTTDLLPLAGGTMTGDITFAGTQSFPVSGIQSASTAQPGVVQLNDTTTSTSTTEALTANQGKNLQDQIDALVVTTNITLGGTFNADTGLVDSVTAAGTTAGLVVGNALPTPGSTNEEVFVIVDVQGTNGPNSPTVSHVGDWFLSDGTTWQFLNVGFAPGQATTTSQGVVQLATDAEVQAGTDPNNAVVSSSLQSKLSDSTSTTSSTTIASSTAVKSAYDAGIQGQTDAAAALAAANTAGADVGVLSSLTTTDKSSAVAAINEVNAAASAAQGDATQAISDASAAQATADQAVLDAAAAQTDATQALSDAASAQATADAAVPDASYTALGDILSGTGAGTYAALALGTADQVLTVDATCPGGLKWAAGTSQATPTTLGTLFGRNTGNNIALGYGSLENLTTGVANTAVGSNAAVSLTTGRCNTAVGDNAMSGSAGGQHNSAFGWAALGGLTDASCGNTAIGSAALLGTYSGSDNTAIGCESGSCLETGNLNVIIGRCVQVADWNGSCQLAIGFSATDNWITGTSTKAIKPGAGIIDCAGSCGTAGQVLMSDGANAICWGTAGGGSPATPTVAGLLPGCDNSTNGITAVGSNALLSLTTGTENIAIGLNAGCSLTTGSSNIAIGASALCSVIDTTENTAVGDLALWKTTGDSNTAVGSRAGKCVTVGYGNTAVGRSALEFTCGGTYNSGVGVSALRNACGNYNAALGYQAGYKSDGDNNVFVGAESGTQLLTGAWNIFLGYNSGFSIVSGCNNVLIGADVDPGADVSNCLMIGTSGPVPFTWLTGDSTSAIKPSAGIIDCAGSCGTAGQVLMSNGANAVCWGTAGGGGSSPATPTVAGTVLGCTADSISALGCNALLNNTTGVNNTATGCGALTTNTTGNRNTATGAGALAANTTGENNTAVGFGALSASTTARQNTGIGCGALRDNTTGSCNTAVGQAALVLNTTGFNNTSVGVSSLVSNTTGDNNTAVGRGSLLANTTGIGNTSVGSFALSANTTGGRNTAVGRNALLRINTGCSNIAVGACSGCSYTTESNNSILGNYAGGVGDANTVTLSDGLGDIKAKFDALGALSFDGTSFGAAGEVLQSNGPGAKPTWVAAGGGGSSPATPTVAGIVLGLTDATTANAALGLNALLSSGAGSGANVAVGTDALTCFTTGFGNVAVGYGSLAVSVDGQTNVSIGTGAMSQTTSGSGNVGVGTMALSAICTSSNNVSVGNCSMFGAGAGDGNVALGAQSLCLTSGSNNVAVGIDAACLSLSGNQNVAIGPGVQVSDCAGSCQLSIGFSATDNWITGTSTKAIKPGAGIIDCAGSCGTAGQVLMSNGANKICWGTAGGSPSATPTVAGIVKGLTSDALLVTALGTCAYSGLTASAPSNSNVAIGYWAMRNSSGTTVNSVALGPLAMYASVAASNNVAIGNDSLCQVQTLSNVAVGSSALRFVTTGACNVALGASTGSALDSGSNNTFIGFCAGQFVLSGSRNTWIGSLAGTTTLGETSSNTVLIGACAVLSAANVCNQVGIFNGSVHARFTGAASAWTFASDVRDKENVTDLALGLDFVNRVQPRTFTWNMRGSEVDQGKLSAGFIAQELQSLSEEFNADYLELVDTSDVDRYTVAKSNLIPVLVKAIQELSEKNDALEARIAALEGS